MTAKEIRRRISLIENVELSLSGKTTGPLITGWAAMEIAAQLAELNETLRRLQELAEPTFFVPTDAGKR